MSKNYRRIQVITIVALFVVMIGLSVGFAAFSNILTISSSAQVKPDSSTFSVLFSSSGTTQATSAVSGTGSGGATAGSATISGTTISGLKANFTAPGQSVTYTFYAHNVGSFIAYLRNVTFDTGKSCSAGTNTSTDMVSAACDDIGVSITVGGSSYTENTEVVGHSLAIDAYEKVVVTISYSSNGDVADGNFSVTFGDISLTYSSVDGEVSTIEFYIRDGMTYETETFTAEEGMSWKEWVNSEYNVNGLTIDGDKVLYNGYIWDDDDKISVDDLIVAGQVYWDEEAEI